MMYYYVYVLYLHKPIYSIAAVDTYKPGLVLLYIVIKVIEAHSNPNRSHHFHASESLNYWYLKLPFDMTAIICGDYSNPVWLT